MTYVATDLSGSAKTVETPAPRMARTRPVSEQPMIAANPALTRVNGGLRVGGNNKALLAGVGVAALLVLGGGTWYLTHRAAPAPTPVPAAAPASALVTEPSATTPAPTSTVNAATSPAEARPVASDRSVTSRRVTHAAPTPIRSLRTPAGRTGPAATEAVPAPSSTQGLSSNLAPQPQAVTPPVISPAPETVEPAAPVQSAPAPTTDAAPTQPTTITPAQPSTLQPAPAVTPPTAPAPSTTPQG